MSNWGTEDYQPKYRYKQTSDFTHGCVSGLILTVFAVAFIVTVIILT